MRRDEFPIVDKHVQNEINKALDDVLDDIISEIKMYQADGELGMSDDTDKECRQCARNIFGSVYHIIEKHKSEKSES